MLLTANLIFDYLNQRGYEVYLLQNSTQKFSGIRLYSPAIPFSKNYLYLCQLELLTQVPDGIAVIVPASPEEILACHRFSALTQVLSCICASDLLLNTLQECFDFYQSWNLSLHKCLLEGGGPQALCDLALPVFRNPIILDDISFRTMALAHRESDDMCCDYESEYIYTNGYHSPEYISKLTESPVFLSTIYSQRGAFVHHYSFLRHQSIYCCLRKNKKAIGFLTVVGHNSEMLTAGMVDLVDHFASVVTAAFQTAAGLRNRTTDMAEKAILDSAHGLDVDPAVLQMYFTKAGLSPEHPYYITLFASRPGYTQSNMFILARAADQIQGQLQHSIVLADADQLFVLTDANNFSREKFKLSFGDFAQHNDLLAGTSLLFKLTDPLSLFYCQSKACIRYALLPPVQSSICHYEEIMLYHLLERALPKSEYFSLIHPAFYTLAAFDAEKGTMLLHTLQMLLDGNFNNVEIAQQMHLHKNTLYYRIRQICELTHLDLEDPVTLKHLRLSHALYNLSQNPTDV